MKNNDTFIDLILSGVGLTPLGIILASPKLIWLSVADVNHLYPYNL